MNANFPAPAASPVTLESRYQRSAKSTVQLRRPTCAELAERPDLLAQLVLATPAHF